MTRLDPQDKIMTLINTFTVDPERAEELLATLSQATEEVLRPLPGFISANLHMSDDRRYVANYAQWRSRADYEAVFENEAATTHMQQAADIAESFDPIIYELRDSQSVDDDG